MIISHASLRREHARLLRRVRSGRSRKLAAMRLADFEDEFVPPLREMLGLLRWRLA